MNGIPLNLNILIIVCSFLCLLFSLISFEIGLQNLSQHIIFLADLVCSSLCCSPSNQMPGKMHIKNTLGSSWQEVIPPCSFL